MKKAAKWVSLIVGAAVCVTSVATFAACNDEPKTVEYTVTYLDGTDVLKEEKVKEGEKAVNWTPTKPDYEFIDWYATPNFVHKFNFDEPVTENKSVFSLWASANQSEDTREYYIVGSGTSPVLRNSNWGKVLDSTMKMTKDSDKNEYSFTLDLYKGDEFQFAIDTEWRNQRGAGYLSTTKLADGTEVFSGSSTIGDNPDYRLNIKCALAGNYTFKLTTHPDDDAYETSHPEYTEAKKENFNYNPLDKITWVRNGDVSGEVEVVTDFYLKGDKITNWQDMYNPATKMTNDNGVYTLEVYLKENDIFIFSSLNTIGGEVATGTEYLRASNLDEASKALLDQTASYDMVAKASGTYKFTYTAATKVLSVTFDASKVPAAADYYLDGTYDGGKWGDFMKAENKAAHKLTETEAGSGVYVIENVAFKADGEIVLRAYSAGESELTWNNGVGNYNFAYLYGGGTDFVKPEGGTNIKVATAGNYDLTFDSYSKIITIVKHVESKDTLDLYIKGETINSWSHGWSTDYLFTISADETAYEFILIVEDGKTGPFCVEKHPKGEKQGYGDFLGAATMGTSGDANEKFVPAAGSNFTSSVAGRYKVVYNIGTGKIDFYALPNA